LAGFFGLEWTNNATIEVIIEANGFNNSLAGDKNCKNARNYRSFGGINATKEYVPCPRSNMTEKIILTEDFRWSNIYLQNATARFQALIEGFDWTIEDTYAAQNMCPYETVVPICYLLKKNPF